jgi:hypothetical protein
MFHYGWARPPESARRQFTASEQIFGRPGGRPAPGQPGPQLEWTPLLRRFAGAHPRAAAAWIAARREASRGPAFAPRRLRLSDVRFYVSDWIERATGVRPFEYRNYVLV